MVPYVVPVEVCEPGTLPSYTTNTSFGLPDAVGSAVMRTWLFTRWNT
jgi:hypothetical protein